MSDYTSVAQLLEPFSNLRLAMAEDNDAILKFYKSETMNTNQESIAFARDPDFFAFYKQTTNKYWTILFLNDDKSIGGIATILRHMRYVDSKLSPVAYLCDLRVSKKASKRAKIQWVKFFPVITKSFNKLGPEDYCIGAYTAILSNNDAAINSLTRGGRGFEYKFLNRYYVQSFLTSNPLISSSLKVKEIEFEEFSNFYKEHNQNTFLSEDPSTISNNLKNSFETVKYYGVFLNENLISIYIPIKSNKDHRLKVTNLKGAKRLATKSLKFFNRPSLSEDGELKVLDITHFCFDRSLCLKNLKKIINAIIKFSKFNDIHIINFITTKKLDYKLGIEGISFTTTGHLFEVHPEKEDGVLPIDNFRFEGAFL